MSMYKIIKKIYFIRDIDLIYSRRIKVNITFLFDYIKSSFKMIKYLQ